MDRSFTARLVRTLLGAPDPLSFDDSFASWGEAAAFASGYDSADIADRVLRSTAAVLAGDAVFERDGVIFHEPEYRWPVLYALALSIARHGALKVLDLGGSLGSVYWQHRALIPTSDITWTILEQPTLIERGRTLECEPVSFAANLDEVQNAGPHHVALLSSVLQYLPQPWQMLDAVLDVGVDLLVIDRTPFHTGPDDIPTLQKVPAHIYPASYPAWILSWERMMDALDGWHIVASFPGIEPPMRTRKGVDFSWSGLIATRGNL